MSLSVTGETMFKKGINSLDGLDCAPSALFATFFRIFTTPIILLGFVFIFGGALFWLAVLSKWDLSLAYPLLSISYIISLFVGALFLGERDHPVAHRRGGGRRGRGGAPDLAHITTRLNKVRRPSEGRRAWAANRSEAAAQCWRKHVVTENTTLLEEVAAMAARLSPQEQLRLIERLAAGLEHG